MIVAPFPFESLPKMSRDDVRAQGRFRALAAWVAPIEEALGVRIQRSRRSGGVEGATVSLASGEDVFTLDVEPALARDLVARALKHVPGIDAGKPPSATLQGAFAAVLVHGLRRANISGLRIVKPASARTTTVRLDVELGGASYAASVSLPDGLAVPSAPPSSLEFPVTLPLVAASCLASTAELAALAPGDVFVPPGDWKSTRVALVAPRAELGLAAELTSDDRLVIRKGPAATHPWEPPMTENNTTLEVALDAPIVVRVELAAVEMKAREWAALAEGDVITLQKKLGEPAVLRIAGQEVARGELVQVDGEYGIRITSTTPPPKGI